MTTNIVDVLVVNLVCYCEAVKDSFSKIWFNTALFVLSKCCIFITF